MTTKLSDLSIAAMTRVVPLMPASVEFSEKAFAVGWDVKELVNFASEIEVAEMDLLICELRRTGNKVAIQEAEAARNFILALNGIGGDA